MNETAAEMVSPPSAGYIYVIGMPGVQAVKIGWAANVRTRLAGLQTGSPFPLTVLWKRRIPNTPAVEAALHQLFNSKRVRGEWFDLGPDAPRVISEACDQIAGPDLPRLAFTFADEEKVLSVLREAGCGNALTTQVIAARTGLPYYPDVRVILARLTKRGQAQQVTIQPPMFAIAGENSEEKDR